MENKSLQRNVLLVSTLSSFLTPFMSSSVIVSLPSMAHDLSMKVITQSWVSAGYLVAAAGFCVPFGRASDIFGRKRIFTIGIVLDILASILGACAPTSGVLIVARVFQGIGGAMIFTLGMTIVTSVFPPENGEGPSASSSRPSMWACPVALNRGVLHAPFRVEERLPVEHGHRPRHPCCDRMETNLNGPTPGGRNSTTSVPLPT